MSGDMADFTNDSAPDTWDETCDTCGGEGGFHESNCPDDPGSDDVDEGARYDQMP